MAAGESRRPWGEAMWGRGVGDVIRWAVLGLYWLLLFTATHVPKIPDGLEPGVGDKWLHTGAYAGLAFLLAMALAHRNGGTGRLNWRLAAGVLLGCAVYGLVDEVLQGFVSRQPDIQDWLADVGGSMIGLVAYGLSAAGWGWVRGDANRKS